MECRAVAADAKKQRPCDINVLDIAQRRCNLSAVGALAILVVNMEAR